MPHQSTATTFNALKKLIGNYLTSDDHVEDEHSEDDHAEDDHSEDDHADDDHADDDHADIDGTYFYNLRDFSSDIPSHNNKPDQDYVRQNGNLVVGDFKAPLTDSNAIRRGWISWQCLSYTESSDHTKEHLSVHENLTLTIGTKTGDHTCHGSAINVIPGGYYDEGKVYKFCVSGCPGEDANVAITNVGNGVRKVVVNRVAN